MFAFLKKIKNPCVFGTTIAQYIVIRLFLTYCMPYLKKLNALIIVFRVDTFD
jgi:hypothetical protein